MEGVKCNREGSLCDLNENCLIARRQSSSKVIDLCRRKDEENFHEKVKNFFVEIPEHECQ